MAAPTPKKKAGEGVKEGYPEIATAVIDDDDDDAVDDTSQVERQYYWLQLLEFKVLPRIRRDVADASVQQRGSLATAAAKTTSDSVCVVVRPLGKGKGKARKRRAATASTSSTLDPPGSGGKRRRT